MSALPLDGVRVLDFTKFLPGPYCTWMLGDLGAEIIRIEHPGELAKQAKVLGYDGINRDQMRARRGRDSFSRNKRSLVLNPGDPAQRVDLEALIRTADVLVEDYRPGVMERMGLGYDAVREMNPRLIYASLTLCGQSGPLRDKPGHDPIALAVAGVLARVGENPAAPSFPGLPIADLMAGSNGVIGILAALLVRGRSGVGQRVDIAMSDSALPLIASQVARAADPAKLSPRGTRRADTGLWRCADGRYLCTTDMEPRYWALFCQAMGHPELIEAQYDPARRETIIATLGERFLQRPAAEWHAMLEEAGTQVMPVLEPHEALQHPHHQARGMVREVVISDGSRAVQIGSPIHLSACAPHPMRPGSAPDDDRAALVEQGLIRG